MKKTSRKILIVLTTLLLVGFVFLWWYDATFSMEVIDEQTFNDESASVHVLIASQGSEFKNQIVDEISLQFADEGYYVKVVDVTKIETENPKDFDAIVILHTWEKWNPQEEAAEYIGKHYSEEKFVVLATSGTGEEMIKGVDGIAGASILSDTPLHVHMIIGRVDEILHAKRFEFFE